MKLRKNKSEDATNQEKPKKKKPKGLEVGKFEIADNKLKLYAAKGFFKKKWVAVREIPVLEIEHIEKLDNQLTIKSKGTTDSFYTKQKTDLFSGLVEQVNAILEAQQIDQQKELEAKEKITLRRSELLGVINASINIVDLSFDVLIGLQEKRINWQKLEAFSNGFNEKLNFTGQTLPPLNLDYSKIASAIKTRVPRDASDETFSILKATYEYFFNGLNPDQDMKDTAPNFNTAKTLISAYFLLNDLLLGKFVGEKENKREADELQDELQSLAEVNFKVDVEELKQSIDEFNPAEGKQTLIDDSRAMFKEQLMQL